jgi:SAM-dependent methyltransferase
MKQNKYDDPDFFMKYSEMPRSKGGLASAAEWPAFRALLPDLEGKRVLDLGCGYGWHCQFARAQGARSVTGIDLSEKMLERARALTPDNQVTYCQTAIEDFPMEESSFDVVLSSLALHYVERLDLVCQNVHRGLVAGGSFVFSTEHPVFTAREAQDWHLGPNGERLHWPVDDYHREGVRHTKWLADDVVKYHRTVATTVNTLMDAGFRIERLLEPCPTAEMVQAHHEFTDELRRPIFLIVAAINRKAAGEHRSAQGFS